MFISIFISISQQPISKYNIDLNIAMMWFMWTSFLLLFSCPRGEGSSPVIWIQRTEWNRAMVNQAIRQGRQFCQIHVQQFDMKKVLNITSLKFLPPPPFIISCHPLWYPPPLQPPTNKHPLWHSHERHEKDLFSIRIVKFEFIFYPIDLSRN